MKKILYSTCTILLFAIHLRAQPQKLPTTGGELTMTPILHATMVLQWKDHTIFVDPYGGADRFQDFGPPDYVLITHVHGDHLNHETLQELNLSASELIAPQSVIDELREKPFKTITALANGESVDRGGMNFEAIPMYNLPETADSRHPKGKGNGYVLTIEGARLYISGDTEDIDEMRSLQEIDYAFVCMNLPYTMDIDQAADAVLDFAPKTVFPFHYRGAGGKMSDVKRFKTLIESQTQDVQVNLLNWYPN